MSEAGDAMTDLARPMQHAINNLVMVMQANVDSVLATLPPEERTAIRLSRAALAMKDMEALMRAFLRLGRPEESGPIDSGRFLASVQPVLTLAVGKPLAVQKGQTSPIAPRRPAVDLALLDAFAGARELPRTTAATARLEGTMLHINWPLPVDCRTALDQAGIGVEDHAEGVQLRLPAAG
jgi:hypothetical protein